MPRSGLLLLAYILLFFLPFQAFSTDSPNLIQNVTVESSEEIESVFIEFQKPFENSVSQFFDTGRFSMTLPNTEYKASAEVNNINDRFIKVIRLYKEGKNTIVEVQFADPDFQAVRKVASQFDGNKLLLKLNKKGEFKSQDVSDDKDLSFTSKVKEPAPISFSSDFYKESNLTVNIVKMLVAVALILVFFYGILWFYNKFFVRKFGFKKGEHAIRLVASYHMSPKQKVVILDVDQKSFACGVTPNNISLISEVKDNSFYNFINQVKAENKKDIDFTQLRTQYLEQKTANSNQESNKSKLNFTAEFLNKVKNLRPID